MTGDDHCQRLPFDSELFGFEVGRLSIDTLTASAFDSVDRWCRHHRIRCLYFLADAGDKASIRTAERSGFELVDVRMTFSRQTSKESPSGPPSGVVVRPATTGDHRVLRNLTGSSYRDTRFYFDGRFPVEQCDRLYEIWLDKSFDAPEGAVFVAEWEGRPAGYVTCRKTDPGTAEIGLIATAVQRAGLGGALVHAAVDWCREHNVRDLHVVTQGRNITAQRLYQRNSFVTQSVELWYHRWFDHD